MVAELGDVPLVLLLTNYEFERGRDRMNDELRLVDALHDNVQLVDWDAVAKATDDAIGPDGLHHAWARRRWPRPWPCHSGPRPGDGGPVALAG